MQLPYDEMPAVYRSADAFVLSIRADGVPRTIMEVLSSGVTVVSTDLEQVRSAFGDAVTYVPIGDIEAFEQRLLDGLSEDSRLGDRFRWTQTVDGTIGALEEIIETEVTSS